MIKILVGAAVAATLFGGLSVAFAAKKEPVYPVVCAYASICEPVTPPVPLSL